MLGAIAVFAGACTPSPLPSGTGSAPPGSSDAATSPAGAPTVLDQVTISTPSPVTQLDYAAAPYLAPAQQAGLLGVGGYLYGYDKDGGSVPELAEAFPEVSDDRRTLTILLRPNLTYSDGTPVEAQDAVVTINRQKEKGPFAGQFATIDSAEAPNPRTIVYHLNTPVDVRVRQNLFAELQPLHPHKAVENDPSYFEHPVSAAQFKIADWTPGGPSMTLVANPTYWRGKPAINRLILASAVDPTARMLQVTTGSADVGFDIPAANQDDLPADVTRIVHRLGNVFWVGIRADNAGPLGDFRVRQAICLAIDRQAINERAFHGIAEPVAAVLSRYRTQWQYADILPNAGRRDLEAAKALLAQAGQQAGFAFELITWGARPGWTDAAVVISENLTDIGITAEIKPVEDSVAIKSLIDRNFQAEFAGGGGDNIAVLHLVYYPGDLWAKATGFDVPAVTKMVDALAGASEPGEAQGLQVDIQTVAWQTQATICPLNERAILIGSRVPADVLTFLPSSANFYVGMTPG